MRTAVKLVAMEQLLKQYRQAHANVLEGAGCCINDRCGDQRCEICKGVDEMMGATDHSTLVKTLQQYWEVYKT